MKLSTLLLAGTAIASLSLAQAPRADAAPACGPVTCGAVITVNSNGTISTTLTGAGPYDGVEDTAVQVVNNSSTPVTSLNLTGSATGTPIFGFDGDGIDTFGAPGNTKDNTGYGGPNAFFTGITAGLRSGVVNFITAIASGSTSYFSLEGPPSSLVPAPEPASIALLGAGLLGLGAVRRLKRG